MSTAGADHPTPAPTVVEARGVLCPVPIIRLARAARTLPPGSLIEVLSDDPAAAYDIPAWCRLRGHELLQAASAGQQAPGRPGDGVDVPPGDEPAVGAPAAPVPVRHLIRLSRDAT